MFKFQSCLRSGALLAAVGGLAVTVGCGKQGPPLAHVTGRVVVNGKPAAGALVTLHPATGDAQAERPVSQTDQQGQFDLSGAASGEYKVTVAWFQAQAARTGDGGDAPPRNLLPPTYSNPTATPFKATVQPGENEPLALEIKKR